MQSRCVINISSSNRCFSAQREARLSRDAPACSAHSDRHVAVRSKKVVKAKPPRQQQQQQPKFSGAGSRPAGAKVPGSSRTIPERFHSMDLESFDKIEVRGNQLILTMEGDASGLDDSDDDEGGEDGGPPLPQLHENRVMDAVVKIFCVHTEPNWSLPWQRKRQFSSTSSGFLVEAEGGARWLLTNAHSVEYHSQVKVKRRGDDRKYLARVLAVGTECDIALLTVDDAAFWEGVTPVRFGPLPALQDSVFVVGYPIGGDTISVTSGVVSRIEVTSYAHGATELLGVQIDAAINSGNSGGPVFNEYGECVGIAFQSYAGSEAENIGYVIPPPVIDHFLLDYKRNATFTGFPALGIHWQRMESDALRSSCGMAPGQKGVLVRIVQPLSHAAGVLQPGDILMKFDGVQIASDGTVPFRSGERIAFSYLMSNKFTGDVATVEVLRDGEKKDLDIKLMRPNALVPHHLGGADPSYLVVSGIIFTVLTEPYLASEYGDDYGSEAPIKLLALLLHTHKRDSDQQVVVLNQVLACEATLGYEDQHNLQVLRFNGAEVRNLRHLAEMAAACTEPYMRFDLEYNEVLVLSTEQVRQSTPEVLRVHSIPAQSSKDLLDAVAGVMVAPEQQQQLEQPAGGTDVPAPAA